MNALITQTLPVLLILFVKITLLPLAAWAICRLLTRSSAATRHLVWVSALAGVLILPLLTLTLPHWNIAWSHAEHAAHAPSKLPLPSAGVPNYAVSESPIASSSEITPSTPKTVLATMLALGIALVPLAAVRLVAQSVSHASAAQPHTLRMSRGIIVFRDLRDVQTASFPEIKPIRMDEQTDHGIETYRFFDKRTGKAIRDLAQIKAAFAKIIAQGSAPRSGASRFLLPRDLRTVSRQDKIYFTSQQQRDASDLTQALMQWQAFIHDSPVILTDADIENAQAYMDGQYPSSPSLSVTFTSEGMHKFKDFTTAHIHGVLGIFVDGNLVSAPIIVEPIKNGEGAISGNFRSLAEAQKLAARLNAQGHQSKPPSERISEFRRAAEINPNDADAQETLAEVLYSSCWEHVNSTIKRRLLSPALLDEAIMHMQKAVSLRPENIDWQSLLGIYLDSGGRHAEAISVYQHTLDLLGPLEPTNKPNQMKADTLSHALNLHIMFASSMMQTKRYQEALVHYEDAIRLSPQGDWLYLGYGDALNKVGRTVEARAAWQQVITIHGRNPIYRQRAQKRLANYP